MAGVGVGWSGHVGVGWGWGLEWTCRGWGAGGVGWMSYRTPEKDPGK